GALCPDQQATGSAAQLVSIQSELSERSKEIRGLEATHRRRSRVPYAHLGSFRQAIGTFGKAHRGVTARPCRDVTPRPGGQKYHEAVLCSCPDRRCADGQQPRSGAHGELTACLRECL